MFDELLIVAGRCVGKPRGWERLVRWLAPLGAGRAAPSRAVKTPEGLTFLADPSSLIGWNVLFFGQYERDVQDAIASLLSSGGTAIDVGANVGWHTLFLANCVGESGRVVAFEPNPNMHQRLEENIERNRLKQVSMLDVALSNREGSMSFQCPQANEPCAGDGHLVAPDAPNYTEPCPTMEVQVRSLDGIWPRLGCDRLDLIKIDVEGWETQVLEGASETIRRYRPAVVFEFDPALMGRSGGSEARIREFFTKLDYECASVGRGGVRTTRQDWPEGEMVLALPRKRS